MGFVGKLMRKVFNPKPKKKKTHNQFKTSMDILKDIDDDLALNVSENMLLAYGDVSYGFGVSRAGGLYVVVYATDVLTDAVLTVDEFIVDIPLKHDRKKILKELSEYINEELLKINLANLYDA